jgi:hypothetical protein
MNRRLTSWDSPCGLTTERLGSLPILQPPARALRGRSSVMRSRCAHLAGGGAAGAGPRLAWPRAAGGGVAARGWRGGGGGTGVAWRGWRGGTAQAPRPLAESERWISTSGPRRSAANVRASSRRTSATADIGAAATTRYVRSSHGSVSRTHRVELNRQTSVSSSIGPACAARRRSVSRSGSPAGRTSSPVTAAKGTGSMASTSITPEPTR